MCGIIAYISKHNKPKNHEKIINQYQDQYTRGQRGFGLIQVNKTGVDIKRATLETKAMLDLYNANAPIQIFHHRLPTSTENKLNQTHPFHIAHEELKYNYLIIHNGVIRNATELKKHHTENLDYTYKTATKDTLYNYEKFNDSESLAIEIARHFEKQPLTNELGTLGTVAFIALKLTKKNKPIEIFWGRNDGNPLECLEDENGLLIASIINHEDAERINENSYEVLDLNKYFKQKRKIDVYNEISTGELKFKKPPTPVAIPQTTQNRMGFQNRNTTPTKETKTTTYIDEDEDDVDIQSLYSPREQAFLKMSERIIDQLSDSLEDLFLKLAYDDLSGEEINEPVKELSSLILEKVESAKNKVRPHFDKKEEDELNEIVDESIDYKSINKRADASAKRFQDVIF